MNLDQLRKAVLHDIDEEADNIQLDSWINRGYLALSDIVKLEKKTTIGSGEQSLPGDFIEVHPFTTLSYTVFGDSITSDGGVLYYYAELQPLVSPSDVPKIPAQYHDILVHYAVAHLQFYEEAFDQRPDRMNAYNNRLADLKRYYDEKRAKHTPMSMDVTYYA